MSEQLLESSLIPFLDAIKSIRLSRNTALKHIENGLMPKPIRIGSKLYFKSLDWVNWINSGCPRVETDWRPKRR